MADKYEWLIKKTPRSVEHLKLWPENPRLNPEENHLYLSDYAEDFTSEKNDRDHFFALVKSISEDGFIPADPIIVWQNLENSKFYVAEGNRRILALKLLLSPEKAPKSIRAFIRKQSQVANLDSIKKVLVNVAPSFEEAEWYINQRNNTSSLQRPWSRIQQQRWVMDLYNKHNADISKIKSITKMEQSDLENFIRILKIKDLMKEEDVKNLLSKEEFENASSYKFPITILERFFSSSDVRNSWGLEYDGIDIKINSNKKSFLNAYGHLIKKIVNKDPVDKVDTRTITTHLDKILANLPKVSFEKNHEGDSIVDTIIEDPTPDEIIDDEINQIPDGFPKKDVKELKNNPDRLRIIVSSYELNTDSYRLKGIFEEFKIIPYRYKNSISVTLRVFIDLAVLNYIERENLSSKIGEHYKSSIRNVSLKQRIEYLKQHTLKDKALKVATTLVQSEQQFSLDVLNGFIHSEDSHYTEKQFLNRFWDFLFPLFNFLLDIKERKPKINSVNK